MFVTMELDKGNSSSGYVTYTGNYEQLLINTDYIQRINIRARELFLVVMTANPCPCGSYGETDKQCLCGSRSISQYWKKLKVPMSKIGIKVHADPNDTTDYTVEELKEFINFPMDYLMED